MRIKEIIVVEGKHDTQKLQSCIECDTLETCGCRLTKERIELIRQLQKKRGVIIFTDPDVPGEKIRNAINTQVPGCKNAFIEKRLAKTSKKVGVEHAKPQNIKDALSHLMTYEVQVSETLSLKEFHALGLNGRNNSAQLREMLGNTLFIGKCNAKTLWKRLNMLGLSVKEVEHLLISMNNNQSREV